MTAALPIRWYSNACKFVVPVVAEGIRAKWRLETSGSVRPTQKRSSEMLGFNGPVLQRQSWPSQGTLRLTGTCPNWPYMLVVAAVEKLPGWKVLECDVHSSNWDISLQVTSQLMQPRSHPVGTRSMLNSVNCCLLWTIWILKLTDKYGCLEHILALL